MNALPETGDGRPDVKWARSGDGDALDDPILLTSELDDPILLTSELDDPTPPTSEAGGTGGE
ncbi:hypothetical protein [Nocardia blacklockiae]|uniref:hypothetical protein n=1 Tax=Nocardia blacklockiae TaxID=480036 RepID=UPI0018945299|nr:hypothetical protein [Nocardia blacklockiae]MBF6174117.1 hypothetical protein [Nocardia blacklockiae]